MMNPTIVSALIGAGGAIIVCLINNHFVNRKRKEDNLIRDAKIDMKLSQIEKKLDEHNKYSDKIGSIQTDIAYIKGKLEGAE